MKLALQTDWRDEDDYIPTEPLQVAFVGTVVRAEYWVGQDSLVLHYADGHTTSVTLSQCKTHSCDHTCMVIDSDKP